MGIGAMANARRIIIYYNDVCKLKRERERVRDTRRENNNNIFKETFGVIDGEGVERARAFVNYSVLKSVFGR